MTGVGWTAAGPVTVPTAARVHDFLLGDAHNLGADRRLAAALEAAVPDIRLVVRLTRTFLRRAVLSLVEQGIRQFLDIGSSLPTAGNVRQIAWQAAPDCRIVQVDRDPFALGADGFSPHSDERGAVLAADPRDVDAIFAAEETNRVFDLAQPIGLLLVDVLHFVPDSWEPDVILAGFRHLLPSGSHLVLAHLTGDLRPEATAAAVEVMRHSRDPLHPRDRGRVTRLFDGFELLAPGVVDVARWHPERELDPAERRAGTALYAGMGRKS
jgi:hypothetical protein